MNSQLNSIDLVDDQSLNQVTNVEFHLPVNPNFSNLEIVNKLQLNSRNRCVLKVILNGKYVDMEIETGSEISCMSKKTYDSLGLVGSTLTKCPRQLIVANGQAVSAVYKTLVFVRYKCRITQLSIKLRY